MGSPVRFTSGVGTHLPTGPLGMFPLPDPVGSASSAGMGVMHYVNDFVDGLAEFTVTGSSSAFALAGAVGGAAVLTPGGTTTASSAYKTATIGQFISGQDAWFLARIKASAVAGNVSLYAGLQSGSSVNDGVWFSKAAASTSINLVSTVGGTATTLLSNIATVAADTFIELGLYYDGVDLLAYVNGACVGRVAAPTIGASAKTLTNALLGPVVQITPTATDTLTVDYLLYAQEVAR